MMWSGISLAVMVGMLVFMVSDSVQSNDPNNRMMKGILTLIPLGFGEILGSMGIGKIVDSFGSKTASYYIIVSIVL
jgi:hypothetical protein